MHCVSIKGIVKTVLKNEKILLCRETAAAYLNLSNGWGIPCKFYIENSDFRNSTYIRGIYIQKIDTKDTEEKCGILCTNKERTICELIKYGCDVQTILESISNYYYENGEKIPPTLLEKIKAYGIEEEFNKYLTDAIDYYNE